MFKLAHFMSSDWLPPRFYVGRCGDATGEDRIWCFFFLECTGVPGLNFGKSAYSGAVSDAFAFPSRIVRRAVEVDNGSDGAGSVL